MVPIFRTRGDAVVALAARQRGIVARWQLLELGMTSGAVDSWVKRGRLHRLYTGVYLLGHPTPAPLAVEHGALLACGDDSWLGYRTAGLLYAVLEEYDGPVEVTTRRHRGRPLGITVHTSRRLEPRDTTFREGLRITTLPRTLLDCAEVLGPHEYERMVESAFAQKRVSERQLRDVIARSPGRRGGKLLTALLDYRGDDGYTLSHAEDAMRTLQRSARLPRFKTNVKIGRYRADFLFPDSKVIVEVDSWAHHGSRRSFEDDRRRWDDLQQMGYRVVPVTWHMLKHEPEATIARIAAAIALASAA